MVQVWGMEVMAVVVEVRFSVAIDRETALAMGFRVVQLAHETGHVDAHATVV